MTAPRVRFLGLAVVAIASCKAKPAPQPTDAPAATTSLPSPVASATPGSIHPGVVLSRDGRTLLVGRELVDAASGAVLATVPDGDGARFAPDGSAVLLRGEAKGSESTFHLVGRAGGSTSFAARLADFGDAGHAVHAETTRGLLLVVAGKTQGTVLATTGACAGVAPGPSEPYFGCTVVHEKGRVVAVDGRVRVFDEATGRTLADVAAEEGDQRAAVVGDVLAVCGKAVTLRKLGGGDARKVALQASADACRAAGARLVVLSSGATSLVDVEKGDVVVTKPWTGKAYPPLVVSADGAFADTPSGILDVKNGRFTGQGSTQIGRFSPSGRLLATERETSVAIVDAASGRPLVDLVGSLTPFKGRNDPWLDDERVATVHGDVVSVWKARTGELVLRVPLTGRGGGAAARYAGLQVTSKLLSFAAGDAGGHGSVAVVRTTDLGVVWLDRGEPSMRATDASGGATKLEDLLAGKPLAAARR